MATSLTRKVERLEAEFWSKAEPIDLDVVDEALDIVHSIYPLDVWVFNNFRLPKDEEARMAKEIGPPLTNPLLPVHPAFLPDEKEGIRETQWYMLRSRKYLERYTYYWTQILSHMERYRGKGAVGAALIFYEQDIDRWMNEAKYIGYQKSREELAIEIVEFWRIMRREYGVDSQFSDQEWKDLQIQAIIENDRVIYGRERTAEEYEHDQGMWKQLREDMEAGKPSSESEAARYFLDLHERFPRKPQYMPGVYRTPRS